MRISDWSSDVCSSDLPDKAIDLVDESASRLRMVVDSKPEEIDELDRRLVQMKIEENALQKESDKASKERLEKLSGEIKTLEAKTAEIGRASCRERVCQYV